MSIESKFYRNVIRKIFRANMPENSRFQSAHVQVERNRFAVAFCSLTICRNLKKTIYIIDSKG